MVWILLGLFFLVLFLEGAHYLYRRNEFPFNLFYHNSAKCPAPFCDFTIITKDRDALKQIMNRHIWQHNHDEGDPNAA
jgi:hypothetical protein